MRIKLALLAALAVFGFAPKAFSAQSLVVNGVTYSFPDVDDQNWGQNVTDWATAVSTSMLQKTGGYFPLTAETSFGNSYGLASLYFKSVSLPAAASGFMRLGSSDTIHWRNYANSLDVSLGISSVTNNLQFNGVNLSTIPTNANALDNSGSTQTKSGGLILVGSMTALSFNGDASGLFNLSTSALANAAAISASTTTLGLTVANTNYFELGSSSQSKSGPVTIQNTLTANMFVGNGSGLTNLGGFVALASTQTFTGQNTFNNQITISSQIVFSDGTKMTSTTTFVVSTVTFAALASTQTFTGQDTFKNQVTVSSQIVWADNSFSSSAHIVTQSSMSVKDMSNSSTFGFAISTITLVTNAGETVVLNGMFACTNSGNTLSYLSLLIDNVYQSGSEFETTIGTLTTAMPLFFTYNPSAGSHTYAFRTNISPITSTWNDWNFNVKVFK